MRRIIVLMISLALLLSSCASKALPAPKELFDTITESVDLCEMTDVTADYLMSMLGIDSSECDGAVYMIPTSEISQEELVIIRAKDSISADSIKAALTARLDYLRDSVKRYLTEYQSLMNSGVVRMDGLTVSLIISEKVEEIEAVYNKLT